VAEFGRPDWAIAGLLLAAAACAVAARRVHASRLASVLGIVYLGLPAVAMVWLRSLPGVGLAATASLLTVIWATDIFAYLVGRSVGGPKLAPRISPGKTWSGLGGGVFGAVLVTLAALVVFARQGSFLGALLFAGLLAVVAQMGDLFESAVKRRAGVKDSSSLIPGHGGMLDRVDGLLFAAPAVALAFLVFGHEVVPW
jgi:phosphatidate cytidylyltransferase